MHSLVPILCYSSDYGGWPEDTKELPIQFLTEETREVIAELCSAIDNPTMPNIPTSQLLVTAGAADEGDNVSAITPPPSHNQAVAESQSEVVVGMARAKGAKKKGGVTPSPMPPMGAAKKPVVKKQSAAAQQKIWKCAINGKPTLREWADQALVSFAASPKQRKSYSICCTIASAR